MYTLVIATIILGNQPPEHLKVIIYFYDFAGRLVLFCFRIQFCGSMSILCVSYFAWVSGPASDSLLAAEAGAVSKTQYSRTFQVPPSAYVPRHFAELDTHKVGKDSTPLRLCYRHKSIELLQRREEFSPII